MKQTEKQKQTTTEELRQLTLVEEGQDNTNSNSQLIEKEEVTETPFVMVTINGESFGTFGNYRITELYETKEQCRNELKSMTWNNVVKIMTIVTEILTNKK